MTESLQFRGQAMVFASSSSCNKPFNVKEEVGFIFKKIFQNQMKKLRLLKTTTCALGVEVSHTLVEPVQR